VFGSFRFSIFSCSGWNAVVCAALRSAVCRYLCAFHSRFGGVVPFGRHRLLSSGRWWWARAPRHGGAVIAGMSAGNSGCVLEKCFNWGWFRGCGVSQPFGLRRCHIRAGFLDRFWRRRPWRRRRSCSLLFFGIDFHVIVGFNGGLSSAVQIRGWRRRWFVARY